MKVSLGKHDFNLNLQLILGNILLYLCLVVIQSLTCTSRTEGSAYHKVMFTELGFMGVLRYTDGAFLLNLSNNCKEHNT